MWGLRRCWLKKKAIKLKRHKNDINLSAQERQRDETGDKKRVVVKNKNNRYESVSNELRRLNFK